MWSEYSWNWFAKFEKT